MIVIRIDLADIDHRGSASLTGNDLLNDQAGGRKITRNQKRKHDEINHVQKVSIIYTYIINNLFALT